MPLELDKKTPHKHYEPKTPEPNDYPNPINATSKVAQPKLDLNNLNVIKVIAAALQEYIVIKEAGQ